jgi:hypothetical protein
VAEACTELTEVPVNVAVLAYGPQLDDVVELVTCRDADAPVVSVPKLQLNAWPLRVQLTGPLYVGLMPQLIPVPEGNVSLRLAAETLTLPLLVAVRVYPIDDPAGTVAASAVLVRLSEGH